MITFDNRDILHFMKLAYNKGITNTSEMSEDEFIQWAKPLLDKKYAEQLQERVDFINKQRQDETDSLFPNQRVLNNT